MPKKIAIDWDETELRLVAAQCSGSSVKVTETDVVALDGRTVKEVLKNEVESRGWSKTDALVAIGRGKVELRELQLPAVPNDELPDMVRFQAIRSFASAGDSATVDYLVTRREDTNVDMIAAAMTPPKRNEVADGCDAAGLTPTRISLRPLCSAALYFIHNRNTAGEVVLIDLLADEAEIVIAQDGQVVFLRTVKLPVEPVMRAKALAGELKRSLIACGSASESRRIILWGKSSVHADEVTKLSETSGGEVETLDPFSLVDVDRKLSASLPEHTGRLAPLIGLLAADELHGDRLIDFLQPRKRPEPKSNRGKLAAMIGVPVAACLLLAYGVYSQFSSLDQRIAIAESVKDDMQPQLKAADDSLADVALVDQFLDSNVNWLTEIQRIAENIPPSEQALVRQIAARTDPRKGGGTITLVGGVTDPDVIQKLQSELRDETHTVQGGGSSEGRSEDVYRWGFREEIEVDPRSIRNARYAAYEAMLNGKPPVTTTAPEESPPAPPPSEEPESKTPPSDSTSSDSTSTESTSPETPEANDAPTSEPAVTSEAQS